MEKTIAVLATLDTKGQESNYLREQIEKLGGSAMLIDMGVIGEPQTRTDISHEELAAAAGTTLEEILKNPTHYRYSLTNMIWFAMVMNYLLEQ